MEKNKKNLSAQDVWTLKSNKIASFYVGVLLVTAVLISLTGNKMKTGGLIP